MKKTLFKTLSLTLCAMLSISLLAVTGCSGSGETLRIYNCYDYIDETLLTDFETFYKEKTGKQIKIEYSCFDTPEDLYNQLRISPNSYDLVCPSDYMIEKMAREDMLEKITLKEDGAYKTNLSPYISRTFDSISWDGNKLSDYAAGYMWGTLGLAYNPANVDANDMKSWSVLWSDKYANKFSVKDSIRDTYFIGLSQIHKDELTAAKSKPFAEYRQDLETFFNDTSASTVESMKNVLKSIISNAYATEVDEGKNFIIAGNTDIYFAWSGDAVYAMDEAEKSGLTLNYSVPEEGSNVWFDGWCVPKGASNKDVAIEFIDFISTPENVIKNMEYIGYVSCVGGDEVFDWVTETYGVENGKHEINLDYFFKTSSSSKTYSVKTDTKDRQFSAQYPEKSVIDRSVVMSYYPDDANESITNMWIEVRS